ncbi:MAG: hypothetical protein JWP81_2701 [Ferruginibacter sp.]|nr:hypothetical protein [Ferruginibacter sp.]
MFGTLYLFCSCNNSDNNTSTGNKTDTVGNTSPVSIDTVKHPSGVDNSSVISTDTAAMNVQNTIRKADSIKHHDKP